jgi:hypothetical protein
LTVSTVLLLGAGGAFQFGLLMHALVWGLLLAVVVINGPSFNFLMVAVYVIGVATALSTSWMAALRVRQIYAMLMLAPGIDASAADADRRGAGAGRLAGGRICFT